MLPRQFGAFCTNTCDFALSKTLPSIFPVLICMFLLPKIYVERSEAPRINYIFLQWMSTHALSHLAFGVNEFPSDVPLAFFALSHSLHLVVALSPRPPPTERLSVHENIFFFPPRFLFSPLRVTQARVIRAERRRQKGSPSCSGLNFVVLHSSDD